MFNSIQTSHIDFSVYREPTIRFMAHDYKTEWEEWDFIPITIDDCISKYVTINSIADTIDSLDKRFGHKRNEWFLDLVYDT